MEKELLCILKKVYIKRRTIILDCFSSKKIS